MKKFLLLVLLTPFVFSSQTINLSCNPIDTVLCDDDNVCNAFDSEELMTGGFSPMETAALTIIETTDDDKSKSYELDVGFGLEAADKVGNVIKVSRDGDDASLNNLDFVGLVVSWSIDVVSKEYKYTVFEKKTNVTNVKSTWSCNQTSSLLD